MKEFEEELLKAINRVASELGWIRATLFALCLIQYCQCVCVHKP